MPGTSLTQSVEMQMQLESTLKESFPEIERVFARTGTAEIASDPMPPNISDGYIMLKPREQWPDPQRSRDDLLAAVQKVVEAIPGSNYEFSQPIQLRFNELISGVRSDVAVKVFGDDTQVLERTAQAVAAMLQVPGASEVKVEQTTGLPMLTVQIDRESLALRPEHGGCARAIATAIGGRRPAPCSRATAASTSRCACRNRCAATWRWNACPSPAAQADSKTGFVPLSTVATFDLAPGPNQVSREDGKRRIVVSANVRGRDIGSFVEQAQRELDAIPMPSGYWTRWGGTFENLQSAQQRLQIVVPVALLLVFTCCLPCSAMCATGSSCSPDSLRTDRGHPGAVAAGHPLSISAAIGFIALSGVAVLNGLVMISSIRALRETGMAVPAAVHAGALTLARC
jgi:cobalt-zinc-cadmium resistance protein CzcA